MFLLLRRLPCALDIWVHVKLKPGCVLFGCISLAKAQKAGASTCDLLRAIARHVLDDALHDGLAHAIAQRTRHLPA